MVVKNIRITMIRCFICPTQFENAEQLCQHIQNVHKIRGRNSYECTLCSSCFTESYLFKRHVEKCLSKMKKRRNVPRTQQNHPNENTSNFIPNDAGVKLRHFEETIRESALKFSLEFSSNMTLPRNFTYKIIEECKKTILPAIVDGVETIFLPLLPRNYDKELAHGFTEICSSMFSEVETERKLDEKLTRNDLMSPLIKFPIGVYDEKSENEREPLLLEWGYGDVENYEDLSGSEDSLIDNLPHPDDMEENDTRFNSHSERVKVAVGTLLPIQFQIKKFFEEKDVFATIMKNERKIKNENKLNHFINAALWKSKLSAYNADQTVIPYHLYSDETQVNNALGTHCAKGLESCVYYSFPTIPAKYASRLENIFVAMLFSAKDENTFGSNRCYERLVEELNKFAREGIKIMVDGKEEVIFFVLGLYLGDNKSLNKTLGFSSCSANCFCRICKLVASECKEKTMEDESMLGTETNYAEDVDKNNPFETGIEWFSIFNKIFLFHVIHSVGLDLMHDLIEGVLRYNMSEIILYCIKNKFFTLGDLNRRKKTFSYDYPDRGNKSKDIIKKVLLSRRLSMTASEMTTFVHNFAFLVGDLIPANDEVWLFYLKNMEVIDLLYLRSYEEADLNKLKLSVSEMNEMYKRLFGQTLKPKHHFLTHYPRVIRWFGPVRYISSLRFEAKHRFVKKYTKNTENRLNISFSLGRKLQYDYAKQRSVDRLSDRLECKIEKTIILAEQDYYQNIENASQWANLTNKEIFETETLMLNGILLSVELFVPGKKLSDETIELFEIVKIFQSSTSNQCDEPLLLCKKYGTAIWYKHFACYKVENSNVVSTLVLMSITELLDSFILPVALHTINGNRMFRIRNY